MGSWQGVSREQGHYPLAFGERQLEDLSRAQVLDSALLRDSWNRVSLGPAQAAGEVSEGARLTEGIRPEALDERQIEDLIAEHLQQHLEILPEQDLANALHEFVDKVTVGPGSVCPLQPPLAYARASMLYSSPKRSDVSELHHTCQMFCGGKEA